MKKLNKPYLNDIMESIERIDKYILKMNFDQFNKDIKTQDAVFRNLEVIGEAANRLSDEFLKEHPDLEIHEARGMRNRLIHDYNKITLKTVWDTIKNDLPGLKQKIKKILKEM